MSSKYTVIQYTGCWEMVSQEFQGMLIRENVVEHRYTVFGKIEPFSGNKIVRCCFGTPDILLSTRNDFLCSRFNFTPLKVRRVLDTVTFLFKLFHNKVDCSSLLTGLCISVPQILSRSHRYFHVPKANTNVLNHSPSFRMCSMFNCFNDICDLHAMLLPSIPTGCYIVYS
jgi:hypothetical protein